MSKFIQIERWIENRESELEPSRVTKRCGQAFDFLKPCNLQRIEPFFNTDGVKARGYQMAVGGQYSRIKRRGC